jgi:hypothetical protein
MMNTTVVVECGIAVPTNALVTRAAFLAAGMD